MKNFFVILGGMGTLATTNFLNDMNKAYRPESDQEYLNYLVFNHATIPDRTNFILGKSNNNPFKYLKEDILQAEKLNPDFFIITCNTAHYFYNELQNITEIPIISMIDLVKKELIRLGKNKNIGLFATEGTIKSHLYDDIILKSGNKIISNDEKLQEKINDILYNDVKKSGKISLSKYYKVLESFIKKGIDYVLLACTEASIINSFDNNKKNYPIIDTEKLLVNETINKAIYNRNKSI
ncbi:MAG: amino acid racemase [Peptoniphilaceae bacterium]|nr:amino acid racemase [Peptoniphilaceae bacterium]MDD7383402.1 amino acid racemase [Peptoniphilaceae bacterium]MDY3738797.1 amino acid racemase [Peptoniphilaceae bacterium]